MDKEIKNTPTCDTCQSCYPNVKIDKIEEGMTGKEVADLLYNNFDKLNKSKANKCVERKVRHLLRGENGIYNETAKNKFIQQVFYTWSKKDYNSTIDYVLNNAPSIEVGTTTTLPAGSQATVTAIKDGRDAVLNFGIPKGDKGDKGVKGDSGVQLGDIVLSQELGNDEDTVISQNGINKISKTYEEVFTREKLLLASLMGVIKPNYRHSTINVSTFLQGNYENYGERTRCFSALYPIKPASELQVSWNNSEYKVTITEYEANGQKNEKAPERVWHESEFTISINANTVSICVVVAKRDDSILDAATISESQEITVALIGYFGSLTTTDNNVKSGRLGSFNNDIIDSIKEVGIYVRYGQGVNEISHFLYVDEIHVSEGVTKLRQARIGYLNTQDKFVLYNVRYFDKNTNSWTDWESFGIDKFIQQEQYKEDNYIFQGNTRYDEIANKYIKELYIEIEMVDRFSNYNPNDGENFSVHLFSMQRGADGKFTIGLGLRNIKNNLGTTLLSFEGIQSDEILSSERNVVTSNIVGDILLPTGSFITARGRILCDFSLWDANGGDEQNFSLSVGTGQAIQVPDSIFSRIKAKTLYPNLEGALKKNKTLLQTLFFNDFIIEGGYYNGSSINTNYPHYKHIQKIDVLPNQIIVLKKWFGVQQVSSALGWYYDKNGNPFATRLNINDDTVDIVNGEIHIFIPNGCYSIGIDLVSGLNTEEGAEIFMTEEASLEIYSLEYKWNKQYSSLNETSNEIDKSIQQNIAPLIYANSNPFNDNANLLFKDGAKRMFATNTVPLIIVAGQSNADGRASYTTAPQWLKDANYKLNNFMMWNADSNTFQVYDVLNNNGADSGEGSDGSGKDHFAFDPFFAKAYLDEYGGTLYAVRQTLGGIGIESQPTTPPRNYTWQPKINNIVPGCNSMCLELLDKLVKAKEWANNNGLVLLPIAILWHQGENDATEERVTLYKQNLSNLISWIRGIFSAPALPFINAFIQNDYNTYYQQINSIFVEMNGEDYYMRTVDMEGHYTSIGDGLHYDSAALQYMGEQMFEKYKELDV